MVCENGALIEFLVLAHSTIGCLSSLNIFPSTNSTVLYPPAIPCGRSATPANPDAKPELLKTKRNQHASDQIFR
jgi:hypothetical protein